MMRKVKIENIPHQEFSDHNKLILGVMKLESHDITCEKIKQEWKENKDESKGIKRELEEIKKENQVIENEAIDFPTDQIKQEKEFDQENKIRFHLQRAYEYNDTISKTEGADEYVDTNEHVTNKVNTIEKTYTCNQCNKTFQRQSQFKKHMSLHKESTFSCSKCDKSFKSTVTLHAHTLTHNGIFFKCTKCAKTFACRSNMYKHAKRHEGIKYTCQICHKPFNWESSLRSHILETHGSERYKCDVCPKEFKWKSSLQYHRKQHKGIIYTCNKCNRTYSRKAGLKRHVLTDAHAHSKVQQECDTCGLKFSCSDHLSVHMNGYHDLCVVLVKSEV